MWTGIAGLRGDEETCSGEGFGGAGVRGAVGNVEAVRGGVEGFESEGDAGAPAADAVAGVW